MQEAYEPTMETYGINRLHLSKIMDNLRNASNCLKHTICIPPNATIGTVCEWFANGYWCGDELLSIDFDAIVYWLWYIRAFIKDDVANKRWDHS